MPVQTLTDDMFLTTNKVIKYPSPFFDLANNYVPKNIKTLFKYCRDFYFTNDFLRNIVTKLAQYPITDLLFETAIDKDTKDKYDILLSEKLKIRSFLVEVGLDYYTYGNSFISILMKQKRFLSCTKCKNTDLVDNITNLKLRNFHFMGNCEACKTNNVLMTAKDKLIRSAKNFRIVRWAPDNIDIDYNPITGSAIYYYTIPSKIKSLILNNNLTILKDIPLEFLEALREKKKIEIDPSNIFHLKYPSLAEEDAGWGKPMILPAMKNIYYLQTLRRGNEAIAHEHIVPKKMISPANTVSLDPFSVDPNTLVQSENGILPLKLLKEEDKLLTYNNAWTKIVKMVERDLTDLDEMYSIKSFGLSSVEMKVNSVHPFRVWDKETGTHIWKETKDLTLSDFTAYPIKAISSEPLLELDTRKYISINYRKNTELLPEKLSTTNNLIKLFGYYISEGWLEKNGLIGFAFHSDESAYHNDVINELSKLTNNKITKSVIKNSCAIRVCSVTLNELFLRLFNAGAKNKTLKNISDKLNREQLLSLLKGIYNGDGTFFYEKNKYPKLNLKLANQTLIFEIRDILISLGYYPTLIKDASYTVGKGKVGDAWKVNLYGKQAEQFAVELGWLDEAVYVDCNLDKKFFFKDGFVYSKIEKLQRIDDHIVLSIEVEDATHSYLSLGYINKNTQMNLGKWRGEMEQQIAKWKIDPNHIGIFPIPINYQELGGNAKMLLLTPEMRFLEETIINSLGVPLEFIKGGTTWTGSTVSLRTVENLFLNYREGLVDLLNYFILPKITALLSYPKVKVHFKKFKMADDAESKQLLIQLNSAGKVSDQSLLEEMGFDSTEEATAKQRSKVDDLNTLIEQNEKQAEAQGRAQVVLAKYQARAEQVLQDEKFKMKMALLQEELAQEQSGEVDDPFKIVDAYALQIINMQPNQQTLTLSRMQQIMPITHTFVIQRMSLYQNEMMDIVPPTPPSGKKAPNEKGLGKREQDKVEITSQNKGHGPTRGEP